MRRPGSRPPAKVTAASLQAAALRYLSRYAPTTAAFRRVMQRRIDRSLEAHGGDPDEHARMLDSLVDRLTRAGALNDARWATARADELHRRGTPRRGIRAKLAQKGISRELVDEALEALSDSLGEGDPDRAAAWAYAKRRRLGPFRRDPEIRSEKRDKDLAAMGRVGYSWHVAREVIDGFLPEGDER